MNKETHIIDIQNEKYHDSVRILQNMCKNYHANKWKQKFKNKVHKIINSPDTVRITPSKFHLPLYLVQQTLSQKKCGKKFWKHIYHTIENKCVIFLLFSCWCLSLVTSNLYLFNIYDNDNIILYSNLLSFPFYFIFFCSVQLQLLYLVFTSFEFKLYIIFIFISIFSLFDLFRDNRNYIVLTNILPFLILIPLTDTIPRYLKTGRKIFMGMLTVSIIYLYTLIFGIVFGWIEVTSREMNIYSKKIHKESENTIITTFSTSSNTISLLQGIIMLIFKNLLWFVLNKHRAILLKSTVHITSTKDWKIPKKIKGKNKFYVEKKIHIGNNNHIKHLEINPKFALYNNF